MQTYLTQGLINESINRLADAARTVYEFEEIVTLLDALDKRKQEAYNKKMKRFEGDTFDWFCYRNTRLYEGDILSLIFTCVCQMHNLIEDNEVAELINKATDKQKRIFFLRVFRGCSPQQIAACLDITDRNVRDMTNKMVAKVQKGLFDLLSKRHENKIPLTSRESEFLDTYKSKKKQVW